MFCLVSRQAMANVLPVLMYKPKNVVLFTTPEEKKSADNLAKLFKSKNFNVLRKDNLNAYDYVTFKDVVKNELMKFQEDVCLNVTGGTKLMALAAYEAFAEKDKTIIYCNTENNEIIYLFPVLKTEQLKLNLTISDYLSAYGYKIIDYKKSFSEEDYFKLFDFVEKNNLMNSLVNLYQKVRKELAKNDPKFSVQSGDKKIYFQKNFDNFSLRYGTQQEYSFKVQSNDFKSGDWLEYYICYKLKNTANLNPLAGVKIINPQGVENEIDIVVLKDFRLFIYSCKTGKKDNQFDLYQLETLRNITSGTFGKGIFVTTNQHNQKFLDRANELSVNVINITENNSKFI